MAPMADGSGGGRRDAAERTAAAMLVWLLDRPEDAGVWLASTGLSPAALRDAVRGGDSNLLAGVMDFVMSDETLAEAFALDHGLTPEDFQRIRAKLPGGSAPNWT